MKKLLFLLTAVLLFAAQAIAQTPARLDPAAFQVRAQQDKVLLIDVRTPEEYAKGHLAGSRNIDWLDNGFMAVVGKLDHKAPVLLYCAVGGRSEEAAAALRKAGFTDVHDMEGGINAWKAQGLPITK